MDKFSVPSFNFDFSELASQYKDKIQGQVSSIKRFEKDVRSAEAKLETLESLKNRINEEKQIKMEEVRQLNSELESLDNQISQTEKKIEKVRQDTNSFKPVISQERVKKLQTAIIEMNEEVEYLENLRKPQTTGFPRRSEMIEKLDIEDVFKLYID